MVIGNSSLITMQLFEHYYQSRLHKIVHSKFWEFEFSIWLHTFSRSMVAVFIPIFLLQLDYTIGEVMVYYFLFITVNLPLNFVVRWLIRKIGARKVLIIGSLFSVVFFVSLFNLTSNNLIFLAFIAVMAAAYDACYWVAHIYLFLRCSDHDDDMAGDTGAMAIVQKMAGIIAPVLGVGILLIFGKKILIVASVVILIFSIVVLFKIKGLPDRPRRKQKKMRDFFYSWDITKDYIECGFYSIHRSAENIIWPVAIYLFFVGSVKSVATIPVIVSVSTIIFTYFASKVSRERRGKMIVVGSVMIALIWAIRILVDSAIFYYASIFLVGLFSVIVSLPMDSCIYEKGEKLDTLSASMWINFARMLPSAVLFGVLALVVNVFNFSFIVAAGSMLLIAGIVIVSRMLKIGSK